MTDFIQSSQVLNKFNPLKSPTFSNIRKEQKENTAFLRADHALPFSLFKDPAVKFDSKQSSYDPVLNISAVASEPTAEFL